ncbi:OTU domain-containing protein, partial [Saccharopolyspora sp. NPDC000995]
MQFLREHNVGVANEVWQDVWRVVSETDDAGFGVTAGQLSVLHERGLVPVYVQAGGDSFFAAALDSIPGLRDRFASVEVLREAVADYANEHKSDVAGIRGGDVNVDREAVEEIRRPGVYPDRSGDVVALVVGRMAGVRLWVMDESGQAHPVDEAVSDAVPEVVLLRRETARGHYLGTRPAVAAPPVDEVPDGAEEAPVLHEIQAEPPDDPAGRAALDNWTTDFEDENPAPWWEAFGDEPPGATKGDIPEADAPERDVREGGVREGDAREGGVSE